MEGEEEEEEKAGELEEKEGLLWVV